MKTLFTRLAVTAALTIWATQGVAQVIRYAEFGPNRGSRAAALEWMAEQIKQRSDGRMEIEFHWGKALLGTKAVLKGVADGVADAGSVIGFFTPKELRIYNIGDLPVANSDEWVGMRALYDFSRNNAAARAEFDKAGVVYISNYTTGPIQLICREPLESLDQLAGRKVRASGPYGKALATLGAEVQRMGQGDVYQALDSGLIDCNQNYYYSIKAYKQYEVAGHVAELDWGQNMSFGIFMNKAVYDGLPDADRAVIDSVGSDFIDYLARVMIDGLDKDKAEMIAGIDGKAITVNEISDADRESLLAAGSEQVDAWVSAATEEGHDGAALLADYLARVEKYAAEHQSGGYPWE